MAADTSPRIVVGTMTGTSIDALDVAIARIHGTGLEMTAELVAHDQTPLGVLQAPLRAAANQIPMTAGAFARLANRFGLLHAEAIDSLMQRLGMSPDLICLHGQTLAHEPPVGWALLDTTPLLSCFECTIVTELRHLDMAHGGQGAPITPLADWILFRGDSPRTVVNLGGFCNITRLPVSTDDWKRTTGEDLCPCNHLLDEGARRWLEAPIDVDGRRAMSGSADTGRARRLAEELGANRPETPGCSRALAQGDEGRERLESLEALGSPDDRLATLALALAIRISEAVPPGEALMLFGGGAFNGALLEHLTHERADASIRIGTDAVPPSAREALAMAVLGACAQDGVTMSTDDRTGERARPAHLNGKWLQVHPD